MSAIATPTKPSAPSCGRRTRRSSPPSRAAARTIARSISNISPKLALGVPCASVGPSIASLYHAPLRLQGALAVSISQSGQSPDIVETQRAARRGGALTLAFVNETQSPLAEDAELLAPLWAGPERSVAATKSMISGLFACASLVAEWSGDAELKEALAELPEALQSQREPAPEPVLATLANASSLYVLGRGATFAVALEAALKLKETCAIHAEAFSAAEVMHGPAELVRAGFPVIAFMPRDAAREGVEAALSSARRGRARSFCASRPAERTAKTRWPQKLRPRPG